MLVTLGNRGSISWRRGQLARIYGERLNLVELLRNPNAAGRDHILFATDEILPAVFNYLHAPRHVLAVRTHEAKLVTYTHWFPGTTRPIPRSIQLEFYDYATSEGRAETRSHPHDPRATALAHKLFNQYVPQQMEAPLPFSLKETVVKARVSYIAYEALFNVLNTADLLEQGFSRLLATAMARSKEHFTGPTEAHRCIASKFLRASFARSSKVCTWGRWGSNDVALSTI
jgi:uncharacterized sulfatase